MRTILSNNALHRLRHIVAEQANDAQAGGQTDYLHLDRLDAQYSSSGDHQSDWNQLHRDRDDHHHCARCGKFYFHPNLHLL